MSHLTQMLGLTVHNFLSAATGLAMAFALVRAFARSSATTVGNFWVDVTRVTLYILLPISVVGALVFVALGMPQTLAGAVDATTLEGAKQTISIGPVASQEIIKELGTNGGGFFNANAAHPFENPNAWTNILGDLGAAADPRRLRSRFRPRGRRHAPGMGHSSGDGGFFHRRRRRRLLVGDRRKSDSDGAGRGPVGGQSRGQGNSQRSGDVRSLRDGHLRHQHRVGQHDARFADAARGHGPDVQPSRRLHLAGRRRRGTVWLSRRSRSSRCSSPG